MTASQPLYPDDDLARQALADALLAAGLLPTQPKAAFDRDKIERMAAAMLDGTFGWLQAGRQPVILGPNEEVLGGHHRVIAAHLAGIDLDAVPGPLPQVRRLPVCYRPVYDWVDVLPDVT